MTHKSTTRHTITRKRQPTFTMPRSAKCDQVLVSITSGLCSSSSGSFTSAYKLEPHSRGSGGRLNYRMDELEPKESLETYGVYYS